MKLSPTEIFKGKKIFFIGGTGFVGKVTLSMLLSLRAVESGRRSGFLLAGLAAGDTVLEFIPVPGGTGKQVDCSVDFDPMVCEG